MPRGAPLGVGRCGRDSCRSGLGRKHRLRGVYFFGRENAVTEEGNPPPGTGPPTPAPTLSEPAQLEYCDVASANELSHALETCESRLLRIVKDIHVDSRLTVVASTQISSESRHLLTFSDDGHIAVRGNLTLELAGLRLEQEDSAQSPSLRVSGPESELTVVGCILSSQSAMVVTSEGSSANFMRGRMTVKSGVLIQGCPTCVVGLFSVGVRRDYSSKEDAFVSQARALKIDNVDVRFTNGEHEHDKVLPSSLIGPKQQGTVGRRFLEQNGLQIEPNLQTESLSAACSSFTVLTSSLEGLTKDECIYQCASMANCSGVRFTGPKSKLHITSDEGRNATRDNIAQKSDDIVARAFEQASRKLVLARILTQQS